MTQRYSQVARPAEADRQTDGQTGRYWGAQGERGGGGTQGLVQGKPEVPTADREGKGSRT